MSRTHTPQIPRYTSHGTFLSGRGVGERLAEVILQVLGHAEGADLLRAEDGRHSLVRGEILAVGRVLQVLGLEVGPESLDNFGPGDLLVLLGAADEGQLGRQRHRLGQAGGLLGGCI